MKRAYLEIHLAVILFGFTAILGKLILLSAVVLVWWRVLLTSASLLAFKSVRLELKTLTKAQWKKYFFVGCVVAVHWLTFYGAIKLANASVALVGFALTALLTALIEPVLLKNRFSKLDIFLGLLMLPGMLLIVESFSTEHYLGFMASVVSAALAAIFSVYNKKFIDELDPKTISFLEMSSSFILISAIIMIAYFLFGFDQQLWPSPSDWVYLIVLSLVCTTFAYVLLLRSLKSMTAYASNLAVNMEPVYGMLLAIIIFKEHKEFSYHFVIGIVLIASSVFLYPFLSNRLKTKDI